MKAAVVAFVVLALGVALVLVAQFPLGNWAEQSQFHHQLDHGLIFVAGITVGAAGTVLHRLGQRRSTGG